MCRGIKTKDTHEDSCVRPLRVQSAAELGPGRYGKREVVAPGVGE